MTLIGWCQQSSAQQGWIGCPQDLSFLAPNISHPGVFSISSIKLLEKIYASGSATPNATLAQCKKCLFYGCCSQCTGPSKQVRSESSQNRGVVAFCWLQSGRAAAFGWLLLSEIVLSGMVSRIYICVFQGRPKSFYIFLKNDCYITTLLKALRFK